MSVPAPKQGHGGQKAIPPQPLGIDPSPHVVQTWGVQHALS
jgi:hypothetical protein